ncbi:MAG: HlyD family efflux transporter periplasmic adaptor subunit [candidate division Zixibacteria bacterium]|nr:HlyD family efflux transporter periplasmic adaptor subunit [candidate division Zixibacteria bacterium]
MQEGYPRFRDDLIISQQEFEKVTYFVIKDPVTQKFFRIKEFEYFICQNLDGKSSPEQIAQRFEGRFEIQLPLETLNKFIHRLESLGFLEGRMSERELARLQYQKRTFPGKLLFIKLKGFDPDRLLNGLVRYSRFLFTPPFLIFSLVIIFLALVITISSWADLGYTFRGIFKIATIFKVWIAIFLVVVLHEFAHALTCKYFGGEVHEMGFLLLYFQPCFFCNVSDAYLFKEKSKRLWVTFAGAYCQIFVWAVATILWRITDLDTGLNSFLFVVVITSGVTVLFNFNPLIKLDGYYLLADYVEIPNLRRKAFDYISAALKRRFLKQDAPGIQVSPRAKKIYVRYGILSLLYSAFLLGFIALKAERFLVTQFGLLGFILFLVLVFLILKRPIKATLSGATQFLFFEKEKRLVARRIIIYTAVLAALVLALVLVKMELKIGSPCEIKALEYFVLKSSPNGTITSELFQGGSEEKKSINLLRLFADDYTSLNLVTRVKEGQKVGPGQIVAELSSPSYLSDLNQTKAALNKAEENYALLRKGARTEEVQQAKDLVAQIQSELKLKEKELSRISDLHGKNLSSNHELEQAQTEVSVFSNRLKIAKNELKIKEDGARPEELSMAEAEINRLQAKAKFLEDQISASQIKSPIRGVVTSLSSGDNLLSIANLDTMRALIEVSEKDLDVLEQGLPVKLKVRSYPFRSFAGTVAKISHLAELEGPKKIFPVTCKIENRGYLLKSGMSGHAKVYCGKRRLFSVLFRRIIRYLRVEVWSWW